MYKLITTLFFIIFLNACATQNIRGTGDLGVIIERAIGRVQVVEHSNNSSLAKIEGLGDLSHASIVQGLLPAPPD